MLRRRGKQCLSQRMLQDRRMRGCLRQGQLAAVLLLRQRCQRASLLTSLPTQKHEA